MTLFQALLLATSLGWTIVEATPPAQPPQPPYGLPEGPKYGNNITSIVGTGTGLLPAPIVRTEQSAASLDLPCQTCPTYASPRVEETQASLDGPGYPTKPSGPKVTTAPATKQSQIHPDEPTLYSSPPKTEHAPETTPPATTIPQIVRTEKTQPSLNAPKPTSTPDSHQRPNPPSDNNSPLTSIVLIVGTKTLTGTALLNYLTSSPSAPYIIQSTAIITPGSQAVVISDTTCSAAATGTELYANGDVVSTSVPATGGGVEQHLGAAILSALGITPSSSGLVTSTTTRSGGEEAAERTGTASGTESAPAVQTGGSSIRTLSFPSVVVGILMAAVALL